MISLVNNVNRAGFTQISGILDGISDVEASLRIDITSTIAAQMQLYSHSDPERIVPISSGSVVLDESTPRITYPNNTMLETVAISSCKIIIDPPQYGLLYSDNLLSWYPTPGCHGYN